MSHIQKMPGEQENLEKPFALPLAKFDTTKKQTIETWMWLRRSCGSFMKQDVLQRHVSKLKIKSPYGRQIKEQALSV